MRTAMHRLLADREREWLTARARWLRWHAAYEYTPAGAAKTALADANGGKACKLQLPGTKDDGGYYHYPRLPSDYFKR